MNKKITYLEKYVKHQEAKLKALKNKEVINVIFEFSNGEELNLASLAELDSALLREMYEMWPLNLQCHITDIKIHIQNQLIKESQ